MNKSIIGLSIILATSAAARAQSADELLSQGREAFLGYRFDDAASLYAQAQKKAKKSDEFFADKSEVYRRQLTDARNFLERVEKIAVIDSITVPRKDFFKAYRLPLSSGSLRGAEGLPGRRGDFDDSIDYVFSNEGDDYKIWAQPDTTGYMHLMESTLLTDGSWSEPTPLSDDLSEECDAIYPFMMADGVTLYYAENGENSIGGYDIMVTPRTVLFYSLPISDFLTTPPMTTICSRSTSSMAWDGGPPTEISLMTNLRYTCLSQMICAQITLPTKKISSASLESTTT